VQAFIRSRRDVRRPPGLEVADFEEYTGCTGRPGATRCIRWLLSTVPTAMIFDDHDISDDWNTSAAWVEHMRRQPWWEERITSGLASYWLYQHLGNLSPDDLEDDPVWPKVRDAGDATRVLREFAFRADREVEGTRWSYQRDFGRTRLVVIDSRCGRVLDGPGGRWSTTTSGPGSRSRPPATSTTCCWPPRCRSPWPRPSTTWRPGTRP
jgi:hypothetical protein